MDVDTASCAKAVCAICWPATTRRVHAARRGFMKISSWPTTSIRLRQGGLARRLSCEWQGSETCCHARRKICHSSSGLPSCLGPEACVCAAPASCPASCWPLQQRSCNHLSRFLEHFDLRVAASPREPCMYLAPVTVPGVARNALPERLRPNGENEVPVAVSQSRKDVRLSALALQEHLVSNTNLSLPFT